MTDRERREPGIDSRWRNYRVIGVVLLAVACSCLAGCTGTQSGYAGTPAGVATTEPAGSGILPGALIGGQTVTIDLVAKNMTFNTSAITVPAGAAVVVNFHNREPPGSSQVTGIAHNFAVYETPAAATAAIFSGEIITGGGDAVYRFTAPVTPGTYFFRCDVHPDSMNGRFVVV